jgi:hypothetical protein
MRKSALMLRVLCTRNISALNEKCTIGMLSAPLPKMSALSEKTHKWDAPDRI